MAFFLHPPSRTQKGKGIMALQAWYSGIDNLAVHGIIQDMEMIHQLSENTYIGFPLFARPCPSQPRHGYIDSRLVHNWFELKSLLAEVLEDDPKGEVLLCTFSPSSYSAIFTPGSLVVGAGHDGATAGKNTVTVPLADACDIPKEILKAAGVKDCPYVEVIYPEGSTHPLLVQLRNGPKVATHVGNYIPTTTVVKKVLKADPEKYQGLSWEQEVAKHSNEDGVVVWFPGGSVTSHFAIHAVTTGMPILFDKEAPEIGTLLEVNTSDKAVLDPEAMLKGFIAGERLDIKRDQYYGPLAAALLSLHNSVVMTGDASKWVGFSAAMMLRFGCAALNGEARHFGDKSGKPHRDTVYATSFKRTISYHQARMNRLINVFRYGAWQSSSFGGIKWACCAAAAVDLFNAVHDLSLKQDVASAKQVISALNIAVNQAHNGGWWLNKFVPISLFDEAAKNQNKVILNAGPHFYDAGQIYDGLKGSAFESQADRIRKWTRIELSPPRTTSAKVLFHPGIDSIELTVSSRVLGDKARKLQAPIPKALLVNLKEMKNHLYLVEGDDGYRLELRKDEKPPEVIWTDESLRKLSIKASQQDIQKL